MIKLCGEILSSREKAAKEIACVNELFASKLSHVKKKKRKSKRKEEKSERELFVSFGRVSTSIIIIVALTFLDLVLTLS